MSTIGTAIDEIAKLQLKLAKIEAQAKSVEKVISEKKDRLLQRIKKSALDGARGKLGLARVDEQESPAIKDWPAFTAYVAKTKGYDLFQKRISKEAWRSRVELGKAVPGVEVFKRPVLVVSIPKARR